MRKTENMRLPDDFADRVMQRISEEKTKADGWLGLSVPLFRKVAAVLVAAALIGGIAYASYHAVEQDSGTTHAVPVEAAATVAAESDSVFRFEGVRLDSILRAVSAHYNRAVCFRDSGAESLRFTTVWSKSRSLDSFIETINEFEGLRLTDRHDTIFVEQIKTED